MKIYGLIPLRKGSTRIKNKNFLKVFNKPLYQYATIEALKSKFIHKLFISTDSNKVKMEHKKLHVVGRSKACSSSYASTEMVIEEFLKKYKCDYLVLIQATNLFLKSKHIDMGIKKLINNKKKFDTLLSAVKSEHFIWKKIEMIIFLQKTITIKKEPECKIQN